MKTKQFDISKRCINEKSVASEQALYVWKKLLDNGYETYLVGGAVRDFITGEKIKDFDLATVATPKEIENTFGKEHIAQKKSQRFAVTFIVDYGGIIEVATFRKDLLSQRNTTVAYTTDIVEDAKRRDFTINSLYMDIDGNVFDPTNNGFYDLKNKKLRFNGNARQRISEDVLRVFRAIRFMALGYNPVADTYDAMKDSELVFPLLKELSIERVRDEILKMMERNCNIYVVYKYLLNTGLMEKYLPELYACHNFNQATKYHKYFLHIHLIETAISLQKKGADKELVLIGLLHDIGKVPTKTWKNRARTQATYISHDEIGANMIANIFERMKFSKKSRKRAFFLVDHHMVLHQQHKLNMMLKLGYEIDQNSSVTDEDLIWLYKADLWAGRKEFSYMKDKFDRILFRVSTDQIIYWLEEKYGMGGYPAYYISKVSDRIRQFYFDYPNLSNIALEERVRNYIRSLE